MFAVVRQLLLLSVNVFVLTMANDPTAWKFDLARVKQLNLLNVELTEGFETRLSFALASDCTVKIIV